uniref:Uncharacterized protein n=1 Tax=Acrobeloides nanus TaxID=290746 RepID=A0A914CV36_9BILA
MPTIEYDDFLEPNHTTPVAVATSFFNADSIMASVLLLGGIVGVVSIVFMTIVTKSFDHRGIRWYSVNLAVCGLFNIVDNAMFSHSYNFSARIQRYSFSFYNAIIPYNKRILQWHYCVYCFTTIWLLIECMLRSRKNRPGFSNFFWFFIVLLADVIPAVYMVLRQEKLSTVYFKLDPIIIYHTILLILVFISWFIYTIFTLIVCYKKNSSPPQLYGSIDKPTFGKKEIMGVFFYVLSTIFMQLTAGMMLGSGFVGLLNRQQQENLMWDGLAEHGDMASVPFYIDQWSSTSIVFIQVMAILIFMPSFACWHRRMVRPPSRIGHPTESFQNFNNDGTVSTINSGRANQLPPLNHTTTNRI